jgi:hypothetical protein
MERTEINDSGVFIPPSPPERKSFWTTSSSRSTTSSAHRSVFDEKNEPFNISRESFDSYRRSFDISARSPVIAAAEQKPRASLDSRTFLPPQPRTSNSFHRPLQVPNTQQEEELEEVALDEPKPQPQKKRGMLSRIMDSNDSHHHSERPNSHDGGGKSAPWHHFGGRKRGQSGQGAELGSIPKREETPKPVHESGLRKEETVSPPAPPVIKEPHQQQASAGAEKESSQAPVHVNGVS